jgi:mycothiol synthase
MQRIEDLLPEGFRIRPATIEDAPAINILIHAYEIALQGAAYHSEVELLQEWQRPDFQLDDDAWVILSLDPAEPRASRVIGYQELWNQSEHTILAADGYVYPGYNGLGIGVALIRLAEQRARQHISLAPPGRRVVVRSGIDSLNVAACKLHEEEGYQPIETIWHMDIQFILYEKELRPGL